MRKLYKILSLILVLSLLGCNSNSFIPELDKESQEMSNTVRFAFGIPNEDVVTYSDQIQEEDEYQINTLDIFEFDDNGNFVKNYPNVGLEDAGIAAYPARKKVAMIALPVGTRGLHTFLFVANNDDKTQNDLLALDVKIDDFKKELVKSIENNSPMNIKPDFLMTGSMKVNIENAIPKDLTGQVVMLTRNVARLDVGVRLKDRSKESLKILSVKLNNVPKITTLFPMAGNVSPAGADKVDYTIIDASSNPTIDTYKDDVLTEAYDWRLKKLCYFFERAESQFAEFGAPTVEIEALYKPTPTAEEVPLSYSIEFDRDVKRNHIYSIILGISPENDNYKGTFTVKTYKWEEGIKIDKEYSVLNLEKLDKPENTFTFDRANHKITMDTKDAVAMKEALKVHSNYIGDVGVHADFVIEYYDASGKVSFPNNHWISVNCYYNDLNIRLKENKESNERSGLIWIYSPIDVNKLQPYVLEIVQPGS